jgi:uncharacterized protein
MEFDSLKDRKIGYAISSSIVNNPIRTIIAFFIILAILLPGIFKIKSRWSPRMWFDKDHHEIIKLDQFEQKFGNDQSVIITIHSKNGIFKPKAIKIISEITEKLWSVQDIIRVESMANYNHISSEEDDIIIEPLVDEEIEYTSTYLTLIKKRALEDEIIPDYFLSRDGTLTIIHGIMKPSFSGEPDYVKIIAGVRKLLRPYQEEHKDIDFFILGDAGANDSFREVSISDNKKIMPFMFAFIIILLAIMFRSFWAVIIPKGLAILTIGATFGFLGYIGITYNSMLAAIPGILLAICIADAVHVLVTYFHYMGEGLKSKIAITYSLTKNFQATLLTSVSTAISFFSITLTDILPIKSLGILAGIGTLLAWIFTYLFLGSVFSFLSNHMDSKELKGFGKKKSSAKENTSITSAPKIIEWINKYKKTIITLFAIQFFGSVYLATKNEVNSDPMKYFSNKVPIKIGYDFSATKIDGLRGLDLVIDSGKEDGVKDPKFLRNVNKYINWMLAEKEIVKVRSVLDIIKKMHRTLNSDSEEFYSIPDKQETVAEVLFLYTMGLPQGMDLNNQFSIDNRYMRMRVIWNIETSKEAEKKSQFILQKSKDFNISVDTGGNVPIYTQMNTQVVTSFFKSMTMAVILVSILLLFVFKDFFLAFLAMFPNVIPLTLGASIMAVFNIYIDIGTSIVTSVCLGIAVDDTIHFISSYKNYRQMGLNAYDSVLNTYSITGKALAATTFLLFVGFGVFMFADFVPSRNFGMFCSIILLYALICDLLFLPAILLQFDTEYKRKKGKLNPKSHPRQLGAQ